MLALLLQLVTEPVSPALRFDGVVDAYAAIGADPLPDRARTWLTQPRADRSFGLNLGALGVTRTWDRAHVRLAFQAGSSVVANYAGEPDPEGVRMIEEAYVGVRPATALWIDAGIFSSAIGSEAWRSTDDPTYTRSLSADYTPYYSAGLRTLWQATAALALRIDLINGWQRIGENNDAKALSARLDWNGSPDLLLGGSGFVGNERPQGTPSAVRRFGQVYARVGRSEGTALWLTADLGRESARTFGSVTAIARRSLGPALALALRGEYYADRGQVVFTTGSPEGFDGIAGSVGLDLRVAPGVLWRTETRWFHSRGAVFPRADGSVGNDAGFLVTALTARWVDLP
jgi:hypothetical protein